ncbi:DUF2431 domain-containing protein [Pseudoalteromonas sp. J010]|uniref:class I SAM-dependent methyltransferase n=1 Tax=Pseudoalteromonas sp. J010 TaxID=998465 RepID=UPI000F64E266|nr:class I SAM-dependent methyltransferase [Pseudoalteromonas sp. J010]RRS09259.1 DUF2431 domain-containing protein [Pseudoalteromonas sp. J010]
MILDKNWRILTVGDGDLSFSYSLAKYLKPIHLTASIYDSESALKHKYQDNAFDKLANIGIDIITEFDVTKASCWHRLSKQSFDAVIFQFPLIPAFASYESFQQQTLSVNTLNRQLLRRFLLNATKYALDPAGVNLGIITSKDVKPYIEWNIEQSLITNTDLCYLGQSTFDISQFPEYLIRNVDRDKHVKDTSGVSYYWSINHSHPITSKLQMPHYLAPNHCTICRAGPFVSEVDALSHQESKKHKSMQKHEDQWQLYLQQHK